MAYALARTLDINLPKDPLGSDKDGNNLYLKDIEPINQEIAELVELTVTREAFQTQYAKVFKGGEK